MSQDELRVLDHWRGVIGARSGTLTVKLDANIDLANVEMGPCASGDTLLTSSVVNDWEPVILTAMIKKSLIGAYVVPRLPAATYSVIEESSKLVLVEETSSQLQFFTIEDDLLVEHLRIACEVSFVVNDLCPTAICEHCKRGAQRCKCSAVERERNLTSNAISILDRRLREILATEFIAPVVPPLLLLHRSAPSQVEPIEVVAADNTLVDNDSFEDISACAVDRNKPILYCTCTVQ